MAFKANNKANLSVQYNGSTNGSLEDGWYTEQVKQSSDMVYFPRVECLFWITVILVQSLATVALNVITIITFVSHRQLRKRSTYILISLAVADMLVGAVTAPIRLAITGDLMCELWNLNIGKWWLLLDAVCALFLFASLMHLVVVSLERLYFIFFPFKCRSVKDTAYGIVIAIVWLIATLTTIALVFASIRAPLDTGFFISISYISVALVTICVCYLIIFIKVRCSSLPRRHGAANRERKLTTTLFIVTVVSLLTWLPLVVLTLYVCFGDTFNKMSYVTFIRINEVVILLYLANSLVNPIVYTIRMPEFRKAAYSLLCKKRRRRVELD